jgi:hypothetical protein
MKEYNGSFVKLDKEGSARIREHLGIDDDGENIIIINQHDYDILMNLADKSGGCYILGIATGVILDIVIKYLIKLFL